jgi:hypothetical protein
MNDIEEGLNFHRGPFKKRGRDAHDPLYRLENSYMTYHHFSRESLLTQLTALAPTHYSIAGGLQDVTG